MLKQSVIRNSDIKCDNNLTFHRQGNVLFYFLLHFLTLKKKNVGMKTLE